jgi:predicted dehydrogenase
MRFDVHGSEGALGWEFERMNELERDGYARMVAGPAFPGFLQPGTGIPMGYDDLRVLEAASFLRAVREGTPHAPGIEDMVATARVLDAIERSAASLQWEPAR